MDIRSLMPSFLRTLIPYESPNEGAPEGTVWLNTNEYPTATKYEMRFETLNRYPQVQPALFRNRYAQYAGVKPEEVLVTRGADEGSDLPFAHVQRDALEGLEVAVPEVQVMGRNN